MAFDVERTELPHAAMSCFICSDADGRPTRCPPTDRTSFRHKSAFGFVQISFDPLYCTE